MAAIIIGDEQAGHGFGVVEPVDSSIWNYSMGDGVPIVRRWFDYRRRDPRRKRRTSPLDDFNSTRWTAQFDDELLDLLNVIGRCVELEQRQAVLIEQICNGPLISDGELQRLGVFPPLGIARRPPGRTDGTFPV
jgi:hypothetical protein